MVAITGRGSVSVLQYLNFNVSMVKLLIEALWDTRPRVEYGCRVYKDFWLTKFRV